MRLPALIAVAATFVLTACTPQPPTAEACAPLCAAMPKPAGGLVLTAFEKQLVDPMLEDIRAGVRPFDAESIGVCEGEKQCDKFLGETTGVLPPGDYMMQALLRVPATGTWQVEFTTDCTTTTKTDKGETTSKTKNSKTYDVTYVGTDRPYRLAPLRKLTSPMKNSTQTCEYTLTAPHADGDKVYKGSWTLPAEE